MRIAVLGAGAVGSYLGGMLSRHHEVVLIGRKEHVDTINSRGLRISGLEEMTVRPQAVSHADGVGPVDVTLVTVKAFDMPAACAQATRLLQESRSILVLQNGLAVLETVPRITAGRGCIGVASFGVTYVAPGEIGFLGRGSLLIGGGDAEELVDTLRRANIAAELRQDIAREVWKKTLVSSAINPLTALLGKKNAVVADDPWTRELALLIYEEGARAALAGRALDESDVDPAAMIAVAEKTRENTSSMLQDLLRGRRTEVDAINGELLHRGQQAGLKMPYNRAMCLLLHAAEKQAEAPRT
jgi:2-dehydropantoate 2-reductase